MTLILRIQEKERKKKKPHVKFLNFHKNLDSLWTFNGHKSRRQNGKVTTFLSLLFWLSSCHLQLKAYKLESFSTQRVFHCFCMFKYYPIGVVLRHSLKLWVKMTVTQFHSTCDLQNKNKKSTLFYYISPFIFHHSFLVSFTFFFFNYCNSYLYTPILDKKGFLQKAM